MTSDFVVPPFFATPRPVVQVEPTNERLSPWYPRLWLCGTSVYDKAAWAARNRWL